MKIDKYSLIELSHEIYSKSHLISFESFYDKILNDEDFEDEFKILREEAKRIIIERKNK